MLYIILKEENMSEKHKSCLTIEDIRQKIAEINPGAVVLTEKYINNSQQLYIVCSDCGRIFQKTWSTIQRKRTCKCRSCSRKDGWKNCRRETEYQGKFKKEFLQYGLADIIQNNKWHCESCISVKSSLEIKVEKVLKDLNIDFVSQKRFNDCRSGITNYLLPFDFYIEKYRVCIEVDGEQYFKLSKFGN